MKIEFETNSNDYQEARKFKLLIDTILNHDDIDASLKSFATSIDTQLNDFLSKPEFEDMKGDDQDARYTSNHSETLGSGLGSFIRKIRGPSRRELELSTQRQQLIERAEHAEASAFEALAETAEIGRERDDLKSQLKALQSELEKYQENP